MGVMVRAWNYAKGAVDGLKTVGVAVVIGLLGLADWYEVVDIKPALEWILGDNAASKVMIVLPIVFGTLRFVSSGAVKWTKAWREEKADTSEDINKGAQ